MSKNNSEFPIRDGMESMPEPVDLERILPGYTIRQGSQGR